MRVLLVKRDVRVATHDPVRFDALMVAVRSAQNQLVRGLLVSEGTLTMSVGTAEQVTLRGGGARAERKCGVNDRPVSAAPVACVIGSVAR